MIKFFLLKSDLLSVQTSFMLKYTQRCISQKNSYNYNSSFIWVNNIYSFEDLMAYKNFRMYSLQPKAKSTVRDSYWEYKCVCVCMIGTFSCISIYNTSLCFIYIWNISDHFIIQENKLNSSLRFFLFSTKYKNPDIIQVNNLHTAFKKMYRSILFLFQF